MQDDAIQKIGDELEIRNLIAKLAAAADEGSAEEYAALFTEDAVWSMASVPGAAATFPPRTGRAEIVAGLVERRADKGAGPGSHTRHGLFQSIVDVSGDSARARTYSAYYVQLDKSPMMQMFTIYQDGFIRTAEGWKLSSRQIEPA